MILNFRTSGTGEPLLILHGVFGSADNWQTIGKVLAENFKVYLIDQRNHGQSFHSDAFTYEAMAGDLIELIQAEGLDKVNLLGHSMGGKAAMNFAVNNQDLLNKLIVVDIAPKYYPPHHQHIFEGFEAVDLGQIKSRNDAENRMSSVISDSGIRSFLLKNLKRTAEGFEWKVNLPVIKNKMEEVGKGLDYGEFRGDTLFIKGGSSNYIAESDHTLIKKHFPGAAIKTIPEAGHWVHAEKPKELLEVVQDFLNP